MIIYINGDIGWDVTDADIIEQLQNANGDLEVYISSGGGSVFQGVNIFNAFKNYNKGKVTMVVTSFAASMASYIALAGDELKVYDNAVYMIHNAWSLSVGDHRQMRKDAEILFNLSEILKKAYISKTGKSKNEVTKLMDEESWFYGSEIKDAGFADEVIKTENDSDKNQAVAFASEAFRASVKKQKESENNDDMRKVASIITEPSTPDKEDDDIDNEADEFAENASKVNAINARLRLKGKS